MPGTEDVHGAIGGGNNEEDQYMSAFNKGQRVVNHINTTVAKAKDLENPGTTITTTTKRATTDHKSSTVLTKTIIIVIRSWTTCNAKLELQHNSCRHRNLEQHHNHQNHGWECPTMLMRQTTPTQMLLGNNF
eukprot:4436362-Amphidinium_carterae.1